MPGTAPSRVLFVTGLTGAGKTAFLRRLLAETPGPVNVVSSDLMHMCREFPVLSNNEMAGGGHSPHARPHLYASLDVFQAASLSSLLFARRVRAVLDPAGLNVVEGGNGYYLHILARELGAEWPVRALVFFYDHQRHISQLAGRAKTMALAGGLAEVVAFEHALRASGAPRPRILPIGYQALLGLLEEVARRRGLKAAPLTLKQVAQVARPALTRFVEQHRAYSTQQLKYMRKFLAGPGHFWFNAVDDALEVSRLSAATVAGLSPADCRPPDLTGFDRTLSDPGLLARGIQMDLGPEDLAAIVRLAEQLPPT